MLAAGWVRQIVRYFAGDVNRQRHNPSGMVGVIFRANLRLQPPMASTLAAGSLIVRQVPLAAQHPAQRARALQSLQTEMAGQCPAID
jgi:hypothetical protein